MHWRLRLLMVLVLVWPAGLVGAAATAQVNMDCPEFPFEPCDASVQSGSPRGPRAPRTPRLSSGVTGDRAPVPATDRDCVHFRSQAEAQAFFTAAGPGDPHRLDADNDGIACEELGASLAAAERPRSASLPRTGATTNAIGLGGASLLAAGVGLLLSIRRSKREQIEPPLIGW